LKIHLITNCTSSKSNKLKHDVKIKDINEESCSPTKSWFYKLQSQKDLVAAIDVYVGDHWSKVNEIYNLAFPVWVVSAGYGLISAKKEISSYNATFNGNNENSVSKFFSGENLAEKNISWWNEINIKETNGCQEYGPIEGLYKKHTSDLFFIVVPPNYLKVLEPELQKLVSSGIVHKENTFIFSSKQNLNPSLKNFYFQAKDNFCKHLGGSRISLNIRLANYIMKRLTLERAVAPQVENLYNELLKNSPPAEKFNRKKMTDEDVFHFITEELESSGINKSSASKLLRALRSKGMACEQKRFGKLYKEFIEAKFDQKFIGSI
jgi:hypothetical protein